MNNNHNLPYPAQKPTVSFSTDFYTFYTSDEFVHLPDMDWRVDNVIPCSGLASVYGHSGVGKSFICLDLAASVACGLPWFGYPTKQCRVVYVVLEGQAGFRRRVRAWEKHQGMDLPKNITFLFAPFALTHSEHMREFIKQVMDDGGAEMIVIDTLNKAAPGADENSSTDMGRIIASATDIQQATGGLVLLVHHSGKDAARGLRGHSSLHAALDTVIEAEKDGQLIRWNLVKSKDGEDGINHAFSLTVVDLGFDKNGKAVSSCVIEEVEGVASLKKSTEPRGVNQKAILSAVQEVLLQRRLNNAAGLPDCPESIAFDDLLSEVKDVLTDIAPKHRQSRAKEALEAIVRMGYLTQKEGVLYLPQS